MRMRSYVVVVALPFLVSLLAGCDDLDRDVLQAQRVAFACDDIATPNHTCEQQAAWGKCDEDWMIENGWCQRTCGHCDESACADVPTPDGYTCEQQAGWGKCDEDWMVENDWCRRTCGRCDPGGDDEPQGEYCLEHAPTYQRGAALDERLNEVSGLAISAINPGIIWVHNDSGDGPVLYAVNDNGRRVLDLWLAGARSDDWEDLALGPCQDDVGRRCLYVADFGQNTARWNYAVYEVEEPAVDPNGSYRSVSTSSYVRHEFRYPGDATYNAETLVIVPEGDVFIVRKDSNHIDGNQLYRFSRDDLTSPGRATLEYQCHFTSISMTQQITGGDVNEVGTHFVLRTYDSVYETEIGGTLGGDTCGLDLTRLSYQGEGGGEAIGYSPGTNRLVAISEGYRARVDTLDCARW